MTPEDEHIFEETLRTGDLNLFTERYFRLPWSGTWFTPEDRPERYEMLHDAWVALGKPDHEFELVIDGQPVTLKIMWDSHYGDYPMILLPHGFRMLPWLKRLVSPQIGLGLAVTGAGSGKSQPLDAKILTPGGWTTMGAITPGDYVIGVDGQPKCVLGVYPQGVRPIYRVTFNDGSNTCVDEDHLWLIDRHSKMRWRVRRTAELRPGQRDYIPMVGPVEHDSVPLPMDPYLLGVLIGDGGFTDEVLTISSADPEILDRVDAALPDNVSLKYISQYDYNISRDRITGVGMYNPVRRTLDGLGLLGLYSHEKFIPEQYKYASYEDRVALLQGLLDTDGSVGDKGGLEFTTSSRILATDMRNLVWSLGGKCTSSNRVPKYTYNGEKREGKTSYRLYINFNGQFNPFHLTRKAVLCRAKQYRLVRRVKSVEYVGQAEAQCIAVEDGLYITDDYIVTHNTAGVCMAALSYAALYPGFRFLNVAPTAYQASLMLTEIEKWCIPSSPFRRFIRPSRGAHDLWIESPYPTLTIEVWPGYPSVFVCQTVGRDASNILGSEQDWINCDEAVLLGNIEAAEPKLGTRLRGTRGTGMPRWGKLTWITNPGPNPDFISLLEKYEKLAETDNDVVVMQDVDSSVNVYVTNRQLERQRRTMSQKDADRWHGGNLAAAMVGSGFDQRLLEICKTERMNEAIEGIALTDDLVGLREYELEYESGHHYVVAGDAGKCSVYSLSSQNIPTIMVFDVTGFLERPHSIKLVAFYWLDGNGSYKVFLKKMKHAMLRYRAKGYYDATNVQSAFEDVGKGGFDGWPTEMIFFSGHVGVKAWAVTIATKLMEDRQFEWPHIRGLWHQARIFDPASKTRADDIIATILVFCLALRQEAMFWDRLAERYDWEEMDEEDKRLLEEDEVYVQSYDRHARLLA